MSYQRRSRPSSAASRSSISDTETKVECRAAFLGRYDDIREEIESKDDLMLRKWILVFEIYSYKYNTYSIVRTRLIHTFF